MKNTRIRINIYFKHESVSGPFTEISPREFLSLEKKRSRVFHTYPSLLIAYFGLVLPGLHDETKRGLAFDHIGLLVASEPEDAKDIGGDKEHSIRADRLKL
jgi:hypothetical protein